MLAVNIWENSDPEGSSLHKWTLVFRHTFFWLLSLNTSFNLIMQSDTNWMTLQLRVRERKLNILVLNYKVIPRSSAGYLMYIWYLSYLVQIRWWYPDLSRLPRKKKILCKNTRTAKCIYFQKYLCISKTIAQCRTGRREKFSKRELDERPTSRDARFGMVSAAGKKWIKEKSLRPELN